MHIYAKKILAVSAQKLHSMQKISSSKQLIKKYFCYFIRLFFWLNKKQPGYKGSHCEINKLSSQVKSLQLQINRWIWIFMLVWVLNVNYTFNYEITVSTSQQYQQTVSRHKRSDVRENGCHLLLANNKGNSMEWAFHVLVFRMVKRMLCLRHRTINQHQQPHWTTYIWTITTERAQERVQKLAR